MNLPNKVSTRLLLERTARGLTQREVGAALGIRHDTVGKIERGRADTKLGVLLKLAAYYDLELRLDHTDPGSEAQRKATAAVARAAAGALESTAAVMGDAATVMRKALAEINPDMDDIE